MHIGIVPFLNKLDGGEYQYSLTMIHTLYEWSADGLEDRFVVFANEIDKPSVKSLNKPEWSVKPLTPPSARRPVLDLMRRIVGEGPHREAWRWLRKNFQNKDSKNDKSHEEKYYDPNDIHFNPELSSWFRRCKVELMLYPLPRPLAFETGIPYVMGIHDLQHRLNSEFPEVSANGVWKWREYLYRNGSRNAVLIFADSEVGKEDILNFYGQYGITTDRVKVLPFVPASYLECNVSEREHQRVQTIYRLPERYLFYPAQFWPHKNHIRIVRALGLLKEDKRINIPIVLCGSHTGEIRERTFNEVMSTANQLKVEDQIHYLGYVPDEDMSALYAGAAALVMPTFFGPTNIPVLEAWAFGCPVITSDIRGIREQAGDAAVLVDPLSVEAISDSILQLWTDENLCCTMVDRGRQRLAAYTLEDYQRRLINILEEAKARVRSEKQMSTVQ